MELTPRRRRAIATALALVLAIESVSVVAATARSTAAPGGPHALPEATPAGLVLAGSGGGDVAGPASAPEAPSVLPPVSAGAQVPAAPLVVPDGAPEPAAAASATPAPPARASLTTRPARSVTTTPAASASTRSGGSSQAAHTGRNRVWIPGLGINRSVSLFPCDRNQPLDNVVYRWGCAGTNNVYLMGHAYSVFKPLHDAYVAGRLKVGMKAWYADAKGRVREYVVKWWKVTLPTSADWAWAAQDRPSMTLQTCVGADSRYRLVVRLVAVGP